MTVTEYDMGIDDAADYITELSDKLSAAERRADEAEHYAALFAAISIVIVVAVFGSICVWAVVSL